MLPVNSEDQDGEHDGRVALALTVRALETPDRCDDHRIHTVFVLGL
ncbi:MAG: hypothetical protein ABJI45_22220 [Paracoccaceae bacterium]